jgi:hypothetical protein
MINYLQIQLVGIKSLKPKNVYTLVGSNCILVTFRHEMDDDLHHEASSSIDPPGVCVELWFDLFVGDRCEVTNSTGFPLTFRPRCKRPK